MQTDLHSSPAQAKFLRTLSASMHQMAQPLSTIQLTLELALLSPTTEEQYQEVAESLLQQLRRAVESMQFTAGWPGFSSRPRMYRMCRWTRTFGECDLGLATHAGKAHSFSFCSCARRASP